jgi:hypothetical protein
MKDNKAEIINQSISVVEAEKQELLPSSARTIGSLVCILNELGNDILQDAGSVKIHVNYVSL